MAASKSLLIKTFFAAAALGLAALAAPAQAYVWQTPYGQWVSDTCVAPDGSFMTFSNQSGLVGVPCQFHYYGMPGVYYGVFR